MNYRGYDIEKTETVQGAIYPETDDPESDEYIDGCDLNIGLYVITKQRKVIDRSLTLEVAKWRVDRHIDAIT